MKIKKIVIIILKICLIILLVVSFNLIMMPKYINENIEGRIIPEMYDEEVSPDMLIIGSSVAHRGISPITLYQAYGITSYIAATTSQTAWQSVTALEEFLRLYNPSMVVLDIGFFNQGDAYSEEPSNRKMFDYMRPSMIKYEGIKECISEIESGWSYVFPVLRYHDRYKDLGIDDFKYAFYKPTVTHNGYIMDIKQLAPVEERVSMDMANELSLDARSRGCLMEILDICRNRNIELLLIKTPSYNAKWNYIFENEINDFAMQEGIRYINFDMYENEIAIDWNTDTPDEGGHLNLYGSEKFSYYLGGLISENYTLPDRREDNEFNSIWNNKVDKYDNAKMKLMLGE